MMSYIDLINGFERVCESEALPAASQLLWYKLIYLSMNKLMELSDDNSERAAIIQQTIICGWSGFYPLKQQQPTDTGKKKKPANKFGQFHQREYDHSELEKQLIRQRCVISAGGDENNE